MQCFEKRKSHERPKVASKNIVSTATSYMSEHIDQKPEFGIPNTPLNKLGVMMPASV